MKHPYQVAVLGIKMKGDNQQNCLELLGGGKGSNKSIVDSVHVLYFLCSLHRITLFDLGSSVKTLK